MPLLTRQACGLVVLAGLLSCSSGGTTTTPAVVATILLSQSSATLAPGAAVQLTATALDAGGAAISGSTISWSTSSATVATVTSTGLVTAVASGSATITATSGGKSAQATITETIPVALPRPRHFRQEGLEAFQHCAQRIRELVFTKGALHAA